MTEKSEITFVNYNFEQSIPDDILKITEDGFYVRGVKVEQDEHEAELVYNAFKSWLIGGIITQ
jgi:hypothetical protein